MGISLQEKPQLFSPLKRAHPATDLRCRRAAVTEDASLCGRRAMGVWVTSM
jgi:hypothetical protein